MTFEVRFISHGLNRPYKFQMLALNNTQHLKRSSGECLVMKVAGCFGKASVVALCITHRNG